MMNRLGGRRWSALIIVAALLAACSSNDSGVTVAKQQSLPPRGGSNSTSSDPSDSSSPGSDGSGAPDSSTAAPGTTASGDEAFGWKSCGKHLDCGSLKVPLDYANPTGEQIALYVVRHRALKPAGRIGSLLVNPGGPGASGTYLAQAAEQEYGQSLLDRFDIIGWDPRGTGSSSPAIDCVADLDPYFGLDSSPDDQQEHDALVKAAQDFDNACVAKNGDLLAHVSTRESATDMDSIRRALGENKISYFGFSYGSELGATWATLFPTTVRAAVLDGAVDPNANTEQVGINQAVGFEDAFNSFLADCAANKKCAFYNAGDPAAAFDKLVAAIDATPLVVSSKRTPVTDGVLFSAVSEALYSSARWPALAKALADAQKRAGKGLLALYDGYYQRSGGVNANLIEAFWATTCLDDGTPRSVAGVDADVSKFVAVAPRFGNDFGHGYFCALWPIPPVGLVKITAKGAGPIVVVGTTGDPATPLAGSRKMAAALEDGHLVTVVANQHTGYRLNLCIDQAVENYLTTLKIPAEGLVCSPP